LENVGFEVNHIQSNGGKWGHLRQVLIQHNSGIAASKQAICHSIRHRIFSYLDDRKDTRDNP